MGLFRDIREASNFEQEFNLRKQQIKNLNTITPKTLELQIFILKYDYGRYFRKNTNHWIRTAYMLKGVAALYQMVVDEGLKKWSNKDFLKEQWEEGVISKGSYVFLGDKEKMTLSLGMQNGIAGLLEGQLFYDVHGKSPQNNTSYIEAVKKWETFERRNMEEIIKRRMDMRHGINRKTVSSETKEKDEEYYDDML